MTKITQNCWSSFSTSAVSSRALAASQSSHPAKMHQIALRKNIPTPTNPFRRYEQTNEKINRGADTALNKQQPPMKNQPTTFKPGTLPRLFRATSIAGLLPALVLLLSIPSSHAGSATWLASPATGDWNTAGNWTAGGPPNGPADTATFATSNKTGVSLSASTQVNGIVFNAGASAFTITASPMLAR